MVWQHGARPKLLVSGMRIREASGLGPNPLRMPVGSIDLTLARAAATVHAAPRSGQPLMARLPRI